MLKAVQSIFIRQINPGTFFNIERKTGSGPSGGGGQGFIDLPIGGQVTHAELWQFLGAFEPADPNAPGPAVRLDAKVIGNLSQTGEVEFTPWYRTRGRYRISNQGRQQGGGRRHPAWTAANGFPQAANNVSSKDDPLLSDVSKLKIYIVKTHDGEYYAGFVNTDVMPAGWPGGVQLENLFTAWSGSKMLQYTQSQGADIPPLVRRILEAWKRKKNVLLYGPPGTGKTYAMQKLWELLGAGTAGQGLAIDPDDKDNPFQSFKLDLPFPSPVRREWVTFHQNFSYENFVLALRPDSSGGNLKLVPRAGVLLDAAISIDAALGHQERFKSAVIYIDEVNRGNVSRIFGEFITFMDEEYRVREGKTDRALPVPLSSLRHENKTQTELVERLQQDSLSLPIPWHFPEHVYLLASMNSVDRAVAPLDTALGRRFERIEVGPDMDFLAKHFGLGNTARLLKPSAANQPDGEEDEDEDEGEDTDAVESDIEADDASEETTNTTPTTTAPLSATETAWLLLYRLNYELAATLGSDFEIGHTYMMDVQDKATDEDGRFRVLASIWDGEIYPQLRERFANRPDELHRLLRVEEGIKSRPATGRYLFKSRSKPPAYSALRARPVVNIVPLREAAATDLEAVKYTLRYLAGAIS